MIALIGEAEDILGFGLAGIPHSYETSQETTQKEIAELVATYEREGVQIIIAPEHIIRMIPTTKLFLITLPKENTNNSQKMRALAKELLGVDL